MIKNFARAQRCGAHVVAKNADESCVYRVANRCRIHASRPQVCHEFFCTSRAQKFAGMIKAIQRLMPIHHDRTRKIAKEKTG